MVKKAIDKPIHWKMWKNSILVREEVLSTQSLRKLITLNEYMSKELKRMGNIFVACYQFGGEKTHIEEAIRKPMMTLNLPQDVHDMKIFLKNKDLSLGSKLHNLSFFIKGDVIKKIVNCILVNDGSTVNKLPIKTLKELGLPLYELFPIHLMI